MNILSTTTTIDPTFTTQSIGRTSKYQHINTADAAGVLYDNGFHLAGTSFGVPRKESNRGYQKHVLVFDRRDLEVGPDKLQLLLTNSHNGSSSLRLDIGLFRLVCANGLVVGSTFDSVRIRHTGDALGKLDTAIDYACESMPKIIQELSIMQNRQLNDVELTKFKLDALELRLGERPTSAFYKPRRSDDEGRDLWKVFNVMQESCVQGGMGYTNKDYDFKRVRKLTGVDSKIKLNKQLWDLATKYTGA